MDDGDTTLMLKTHLVQVKRGTAVSNHFLPEQEDSQRISRLR